MTPIRRCEKCGRPAVGVDRCPHAISSRYDCPHDKARSDRDRRMRYIGRWAQ